MKTPSSKISYMARIILKKSHYLQKIPKKFGNFKNFTDLCNTIVYNGDDRGCPAIA